MAHAHCMLDTEGYKYTNRIRNTYSFSTAPMALWTRLNIQGAYKLSKYFTKLDDRCICNEIVHTIFRSKSQEDHDVQIAVGTRVGPPQIPGHQLRSVDEATISLHHWFTLFPRDGSSDYRTIPNLKYTVCNRHEFHDPATLPTQVMA
jgi:hypothetical protein